MSIMNGSGLPERQNLIKSLAMSLKRKASEIAFSDDIKTLNGISVIYHVESGFAWLIPDLTGELLSSFNPPKIRTNIQEIDLTQFNIERGNFHQQPQYDFSTGFTLINGLETVVFEGVEYRWGGVFNKVVPANSTPESAGGVGDGAWVGVGDTSLRNEITSPSGGAIIPYKRRNILKKLEDSIDIKDFGATPGDVRACTQAMAEAKDHIKTLYRGVGKIGISNSDAPDKPYIFDEPIILDSQGLRIVGDSRWGSNIQTTANVETAILVTGSSCEVSHLYLTTAEGAKGLHLKDGNNFTSDDLVVKIAEIGLLHEKNNSSWIRNFLAESCGTGYKMYPTLASDCNGSHIDGRAYNCEIGFDLTAGSDGTKHPGMNSINFSCEGNVIGFRETGGRYNILTIYSESNRKVSAKGNANANFSTIGSPNFWFSLNPDNDEDVIKGPAIGFYSRGGNMYQKIAMYEKNIKDLTIQTGNLGDASVGFYVLKNGLSTTYQLTLTFLSYMRPGQEITLIANNTANGWNIRQFGGVVLVGDKVDGDLFGASVATGKYDILKITKISNTLALTQFNRGT